MGNNFKSNIIWNVALYTESPSFRFNSTLKKPFKVFGAKKLRTSRKHVHTLADPFLFTKNETLYLFYESQSVSEQGKIELAITKDLVNFENKGVVLEEKHHLSYPFVFETEQGIFMVPESSAAGEVALYQFQDFPAGLKKVKRLLTGPYFDSSFIKIGDTWYLFTALEKGLEIFFTRDFVNEDLQPHPANPVCTDKRFERCGGGPVLLNGELYRIAQDCSGDYGKNISIMQIGVISESAYQEKVLIENYFENDQDWNAEGGHHLSFARFKDKLIIAVDGKQHDFLVNKFLSPLFKLA